MHTPTRWLLLVSSLATLGLSACDKSDVDDDAHADHGSETDAHETSDPHETGEAEGCAVEIRDDDFTIGLSKSGALIQASFVSADPAPPIKGDNTWVISLTDLQGQPLANATLEATPMMPDHGHGTPVVAVVTALETPGHYEISPVNLFMAGFWEISVDATLPAGEQDTLVFGFCVE